MTELSKIFSAGDSLEWEETIPEYSASDGYKLIYALRGPQVINIKSTPNGTAHKFDLKYTDTKDYEAGDYHWVKHVEKAAYKKVITRSTVVIRENLIVQVAGYDGRTDAQQILASLMDAYKKVGSKTAIEVSWPNGARVKYQRTELLDEIKRWKNIIFEEQAAIDLEMGNEIDGHFKFGFGG